MRVAVEWWAPEMGASGLDSETPGADLGDRVAVELAVEVPIGSWAPRRPDGPTRTPILFVDGVRRIDARLWLTDDHGETRAGLCASYAAGVVRCREGTDGARGEARLSASRVERGVFASRSVALGSGPATYPPRLVAEGDEAALSNAIQERLRALEVEVASGVDDADALLVVDGPLSARTAAAGAVGYVKSHRVEYLGGAEHEVLASLAPGERTPLFVTTSSWSRYCWYLRLPGPGTSFPASHPWAGIARCELSADRPVESAVELADAITATLPRFASRPHKESRAPQNLYPIAGLEAALRRRLGDRDLLFRRILAAAGRLTP